jgi:hypothetical protein
MPYVITTSKFPLNKADEAAKIYVKTLKEFRSVQKTLTKEVVPNAIKATDDGIESIGVHDVKQGKLEEFLLLSQKYMVNYHDIEGYKYKIEVRFKAEEALEMIGMKMPE